LQDRKMANSIVALTDTASQIAELQRRQKLAEALSAQGAAPIEVQSYKGIQAPISPLSGIAKVLQAYLGAKQSADAIKGEKEARKTAREESQTALKQYYGNPEFSKFENPMSAQEAAVPALTPIAPPETIQMGGVPTNVKGNVTPVTSAQGPTTYNNAQYIEPQTTQGRETTPQERMAMALQFQGSGNPMLEQMAPALYGEARGEAKSAKVFDAIGKANQAGADPAIMNAFKAAGDSSGAVSYLGSIGLKKEEALAAAEAYKIKAADTAEQRQFDREARADERAAQRDLTLQIAQMGNDTRRDIAAAVGGRGPKITEGQRRSAALAYRALEGNNRLNDLAKQGIYAPSTPFDSLFKRDKNGLTTIVFKSDQDRKYIQAFKEFIAPILRLDSGAAVPDAEVESYMQTYGNKFEDSPQVRWQKAQGRTAAIRSVVGMGRPAFEEEYGPIPEFQVLTDPRGRPVAPGAPKPIAPAGSGKSKNVTVSNF
jgi:hypothetical protein